MHFYLVEANPISAETAASFQYPIDWQIGHAKLDFHWSKQFKKGWNHHQPRGCAYFSSSALGNIQEMNELHPQEQCIDFFFHDPFPLNRMECWEPSILGYTRNGDVTSKTKHSCRPPKFVQLWPYGLAGI